MKILFVAIISLFSVAAALIPAQAVAWALATYHIHSGLIAPWLFVVTLESAITGAILSANYILED